MTNENIAAALAAFQGEMPTVAKAETAEVQTKTGGKYKYTYATLADVTRAAAPLLAKHGLSFSCWPERTDGHAYELVGSLLHTSGEKLSGVLPLFGSSPQELGSSITYARRYLLGCLTGIVTEDDDDGATAQGSAAYSRQPSAQELISDARAKAWAAWKSAGFGDDTDSFRASYERFMDRPFNAAAVADFDEFAAALVAGAVTPVDPAEQFQRALGAQSEQPAETPA